MNNNHSQSNDEYETERATSPESSPALVDENVNNLPKVNSAADKKLSRLSKSRLDLFKTLLKSRILRYLLSFLVLLYALFNLSVCSLKFHVGLPMVEILPKDSYTRKHMINHFELFDLAPIVTVNFLKPRTYWNINEFRRIRSFLDEAKQVKGMDKRFEWNWLQDTYDFSELR